MTPVEAVARAICGEDPNRVGPFFCDDGRRVDAGQLAWTAWTEEAKAAIRALAENVTDEMADRFWVRLHREDDATTKLCIRAAILAAMEDEA